jgi:hypothetical protein
LSIGCIPDDPYLLKDASSCRYKYSIGGNQLQLERKDEMKRRGEASPDRFEALVQTFAKQVARTDVRHSKARRRNAIANDIDYPMFG